MATIKTAVSLYDGVTGPLRSMARVLDSVIGTFEDLETASGNGLDPAQFASARAELSKMSGQLETIEQNVNRSSDAQKGLNREIRGGSAAADGLAGKVKSLIAAYAGVQTLGKAVGLSDSVSSMSARLSALGGDAQETEKKVMACANRSRSAFLDTADAVAKLGTNAGEAFGNDIDQIIGFSELVGKQFVLSGATAQEQSAAMLQLTQAMASGVLRGDELNSIFEQAPGLIQRIADYLGVSIGEIRGLASNGAITADVIKNAMFGAADEINQKFEEMPKTWGQIWTLAGNRLLEAFRPALDRFSELINSDGFTAVWDGLIGGISSFSGLAVAAMDGVSRGLHWIAENADTVRLVLVALGAAAMVYGGVMASQAVTAAVAWLMVNWPLLLIIGSITAVIAAAHAMGASFSAIGAVIGGVFGLLWTQISNLFIVPLWNGIAMLVNFIGNAFNSPAAAVKVAFYDMCLTVIGYIKNLAQNIENLLNRIPGVTVDLTSGLSSLYSGISAASQSVKDASGWKEYVKTMDYTSASDGWAAGAAKGSAVGKWLDHFSFEKYSSGTGSGFELGNAIAGNTGATAANTAKAANALDIAKEDLAYMRDIAEREAINRYTTAEIVINQTNNNSIDSEQDLDGISAGLAERIIEEVNVSAEGDHV